MSDFLSKILAARRARVARDFSPAVRPSWRERAAFARARRDHFCLRTALAASTGLIAEFKRRSPSRGLIRPEADPALVAAQYAEGGACAVSVLTEPDFFQGSLADLRAAREAVSLPVLRKDFIVDEVQIDEAAVAGAEAVLLIVAALGDGELERFRRRAEDDLGLDALVEVHTPEEMRRAAGSGASLIGVNNRNLSTFAVSLDTSEELALLAPEGSVLVSESGIHGRADVERLRALGYRGFLVGEALMRSDHPAALLRSLGGAVNGSVHR